MDVGIPVPVIDIAVSLRDLSAAKEERVQASALYKSATLRNAVPNEVFISQLADALFSMIICYAQGMALLYKASSELKMDIPLPEVVRIWRGGCIIRSSMLEIFLQSILRKSQTSQPFAR
jgi:6-phosphogluconate dehydrogenase